MDTASTVKLKLKQWEIQFTLDNKRKPNKDDISVAPDHVRDMYKEYAALKKREAKKGEDQHVEVWGSQLSKSCSLSSTSKKRLELEESAVSYTNIIGPNLLARSSKKIEVHRTSLGLSRKQKHGNSKSAILRESNSSESTCRDADSDYGSSLQNNSFFSKALKLSQSGKVTSRKDNKSSLPLVQVSKPRWTSVNPLVLDKTNDSFLESLSSPQEASTGSKSILSQKSVVDAKQDALKDCQSDTFLSSGSNQLSHTKLNGTAGIDNAGHIKSAKHTITTPSVTVRKEEAGQYHGTSTIKECKAARKEECVASPGCKAKPTFVPHPCGVSLPQQSHLKSEGTIAVFDFTEESNSPMKAPNRVSKRKRGPQRTTQPSKSARSISTKVSVSSVEIDEESQDSNSEPLVGWRPESEEKLMVSIDADERKTAPIMAHENDIGVSAQSYCPANKSVSKQKSKPLSNDNFVRLNMKVKSYRRKGKGMTGPQHKRFQWKQKMRARAESRGTTACFKCGQEGHWAKKCKGPKKEKTPPDNPFSEEDPMKTSSMTSGTQSNRKVKSSSSQGSVSEATQENTGAKFVMDSEMFATEQAEEEYLSNIVRNKHETPALRPPIKPLYALTTSGELPKVPDEVYTALRQFGFNSFRSGQEKAIMRILCGQSTLVVLSTGAGKSLCYQLPAFLYAQRSNCITLVISPLVSLMEDQVTGLPPGVRGACLHTNMTSVQRDKVMASVIEGGVHFVLISPESLVGGGASGILSNLEKFPPIAFACVDEAHCVSEWSHHFRPSYLRLCKVLKERLGVQCLLGLTATATITTAISVAQHLGIRDYESATIRGIPIPPNLLLSASRDEDKDGALLSLLQGERFGKCSSIIIYCTRRQQTDRLAALIRTHHQGVALQDSDQTGNDVQEDKPGKKKTNAKAKSKLIAECYHAGLSAAQRKLIQNAFMCDRLRIVVATVAFGMGLDKPDVRGVIHYDMPKNFESYVQEIGRAGRDGIQSHCHVLLSSEGKEVNELKRHIHANMVDMIVVKKLVSKIFPQCRCRELEAKSGKLTTNVEHSAAQENPESRLCPGHERAIPIDSTVQALDMKDECISTLLCYLELHPKRWIESLQHTYATCTLHFYGGMSQMQEVAKKCPPVAVAITKAKRAGTFDDTSTKLTFPVVDVCDYMGWQSGVVKRELRNLQWNLQESCGPRRSGVITEYSDLAYHVQSPGDLTDEEVDEVVDFLYQRLTTQEKTELQQLKALNQTMRRISYKHHWMCEDTVDEERSGKLKKAVHDYFNAQPGIDVDQVTVLSFAKEVELSAVPVLDQGVSIERESGVRADIRSFIQIYGHEYTLSGRSIARIFHGIPSPCFPADIWGRVRRFWRCHLDVDFNVVRKLATQEVIRMK